MKSVVSSTAQTNFCERFSSSERQACRNEPDTLRCEWVRTIDRNDHISPELVRRHFLNRTGQYIQNTTTIFSRSNSTLSSSDRRSAAKLAVEVLQEHTHKDITTSAPSGATVDGALR
jgi:hypothetical protein